MTDDDKRLFNESISEMRELRGEIREFKQHVIGRIERLEHNEGKRGQNMISTISVFIAAAALIVGAFSRFA